MLSLLSVILGPVVGLLDKIFGYVADVKTTQLKTEAEVDVAGIQGMSAVEQKWPFVAFMVTLIAFPFALWTAKAVGWDKVVGPMFGYHSVTDPLVGDLSKAYWIVITGLFMHRIIK